MRSVLTAFSIRIAGWAAITMLPAALALDGSIPKEGARFLGHPSVEAIVQGVYDQYECKNYNYSAEQNVKLSASRRELDSARDKNRGLFYTLSLLISCRESSLESATFRFLVRAKSGAHPRQAVFTLEGAHFQYAVPLPPMQLVESPYTGPVHSDWAIQSQPIMSALLASTNYSPLERCQFLPPIESRKESSLEAKHFSYGLTCNLTRPAQSNFWLIQGWYYPRFDFFRFGDWKFAPSVID